MIPFFVLDRQASLEILKGLFFKFPNLQFGLMTHANVSPKFIEKYRAFPYKTPLKYFDGNVNQKKLNRIIRQNIIKISDSGIFQKNGTSLSYEELFERYIELKVEFGIMKDVLHNMEETIKSAEEALNVYHDNGFSKKFKLIGVAQGKNIEEYVKCYGELLNMGYKYIAIGGLLKRNGTSNYVKVRSEDLLEQVITSIKEEYSPEWLFVLGVYHPKRHKTLEELGVWGSDYKGWLFHYDEYYKSAIAQLEESGKITPKIRQAYYYFLKCKRQYLKDRTDKNREKYWKARKRLDNALKEIGTSLQELRFREVRETIEKEVVSQMLVKIQ